MNSKLWGVGDGGLGAAREKTSSSLSAEKRGKDPFKDQLSGDVIRGP